MLNTDSKKLAVDFPEDVKIPIEPNQIATPAWNRSKIKFSYCQVSRAIKLDRDHLLFHIKKNSNALGISTKNFPTNYEGHQQTQNLTNRHSNYPTD